MRSHVLKRVAFVTLVCFSSSLKAQATSPFGNDQLSDMKLVAKIYELSVESYKVHKDPSEFLWGVRGLVGEDVEQALEIAVAYHNGALPVIEANDAKQTFTIRSANQKTVTIKVEDVDLGKFRINNEPFVWDESKSFEENTGRISNILSNQVSFLDFFEKLSPFATAHAGGDEPVEYNGPSVIRHAPKPTTKTPEKIRADAKRKCEEKVESGKKRCGWGFWLGVTLVAVGAALIIYALTRKKSGDKKKKDRGSRPDRDRPSPPRHEWVDAADGIQGSLAVPPLGEGAIPAQQHG